MGKSLAEQIATLPQSERDAVLSGMDLDDLKYDWSVWSRPEQRAPDGDTWNIFLLLAGRGFGKPLCDETPIPTPQGYTRIADLVVGDTVFDHAKRPTSVTDTYSRGISPRLKVTFDDGSVVDAADDHEWLVVPVNYEFEYWNDWWRADGVLRVETRCLRVKDAIPTQSGSRTVVSVERIDPGPVTCISVDADSHLFLAGRGMIPTHNTRSSAEWVREKAKDNSRGPLRIALVGRTAADVRDVIIQGESGILNISPPSERPEYQPSLRKLTWPNGTTALSFSSEEPSQLRGPAFDYAFADEFAAWRQIPDEVGMTAFSNLRIANRLGPNPQLFIATTPKRVEPLKALLREAETNSKIIVRRGSTRDNAGNLSEAYLDGVYGTYGSTKLAQQELEGIMLDDVEGVLWTVDSIESNRHAIYPLDVPFRVVGVDPTVAERPGDECGIVVVSGTSEHDLYRRQAWVLEDATIQGPPDVWAQQVVAVARKWGCPVVAEVNQGGRLVKNTINAIDPSIKVFEVYSKQGKQLRAEPISLAYQQGRVHHVGELIALEEQMLSWEPGVGKSPDRVDALVHALTALLITPPPGFGGGVIQAKSPAAQRLPSVRSMAMGKRGAGPSARGGGGVAGRGARVINPRGRR